MCAGHAHELEDESSLWSRYQQPLAESNCAVVRRRGKEAGWQNRNLMDKNRVQGGTAWASRHFTTKPVISRDRLRRRGRCAGKVRVLTPGDLGRCPGCPTYRPEDAGTSSWGGMDSGFRKMPVHGREVSSGHSRSGDSCSEGPNAMRGTHRDACRAATIDSKSQQGPCDGP